MESNPWSFSCERVDLRITPQPGSDHEAFKSTPYSRKKGLDGREGEAQNPEEEEKGSI